MLVNIYWKFTLCLIPWEVLNGYSPLGPSFQQPCGRCRSCYYFSFMVEETKGGERVESSVLTISFVRRVGDMAMALICTYFYYCDREEKELSLKSCPKYSTCYLCDIKCFPKLVHDNMEKSLNCRSLKCLYLVTMPKGDVKQFQCSRGLPVSLSVSPQISFA